MSLIKSNFNLFIYILLWVGTIVVYQLKKKTIDSGTFVLFSYLGYSIASLILFNLNYFPFEEITLLPFIYLYVMLMVAFYPFLSYKEKRIDAIDKPSHLFINLLSLIFIISSIAQIPSIFSNFSTNLIRLITISSGGLDLYNEAMAESYSLGDGDISNLMSVISNAFGSFGILLFFYRLTLKKSSRLLSVGLFFSILLSLFNNISLGQRGPIVEIVFATIVSFILLRKFLDDVQKRMIKIIGIGFLVISLTPIVLLTNSRFGDSLDGAGASVYFYVGQQNLFFNNYAFDNGGIRYGDRTFPLFKRMVGIENVPNNFWERRVKYPNLKINDEFFINFVGDFVLDFGPIIASIIFLIVFFSIGKLVEVKGSYILFHQLILIHFTLTLCVQGGIKLYPFSDVGGNLQLIFYVLMYFLFLMDYRLRQIKKIKKTSDDSILV